MKYIFYDSESIDIKHKYSFTFGYLITDDKFNIISPKKDIIFNPDCQLTEWDWRAYRKILKDSYTQKQILSAKNFSHFYNKIKKLLTQEDVLCIGFEINEDVKYLLNNCDKYQLDAINFKYLDVRKIIKLLTEKEPNSLAKEYIRYFHKPYMGVHRSDVDAEMTMLVLKEVLKKYKKNLLDLIKENDLLIGESKDFVYGFKDFSFDIKNPQNNFDKGFKKLRVGREDFIDKGTINYFLFNKFTKFAKITESAKQIFKDKKICISLNYESFHFKNMLKIVQLITNAGGQYIKNVAKADVFVKYDFPVYDEYGKVKPCRRYKKVSEINEQGEVEIKIIEFDKFLSMLNLTKEDLESMPEINIEYLNDINDEDLNME